MKALTSALRRLLLVILLIAVAWFVLSNWSFVFAKKIRGEVVEVERVTQPGAIIGGANISPDMIYSFAVMIRDFNGNLYSASSEDRQWAVAKRGYCVEAKFFPYPPWDFANDGTFFNARLVGVFDCKKEAPPGWTTGVVPVPETQEKSQAPAGSPSALDQGRSVEPTAAPTPAQIAPQGQPQKSLRAVPPAPPTKR